MGILSIILAIAPVVLQSLSGTKLLPTNIGTLIQTALTSIETFIATFTSSNTTTTPGEAIAVLSALSAVIAVLKQQTTLPASDLAIITALDTAISAGIAAYSQAGKTVDPTALQPITPA